MNQDEAASAFKKLLDVVIRLRSPDGCPWDLEQTPSSLRGDLIEEIYECVEAIDEGEPAHIKEELGDIFLLASMIAYMHEQQGLFTVAATLEGISEKLIRRHPHVFGTSAGKKVEVKNSAEVLQNWAKIKVEQEGRKPKDSVLDEVSRGLPPLDRAWKLQKKAAKSGFDWSRAEDVIAKVEEELDEVKDSIADIDPKTEFNANRANSALEGELGDLLFSAVNLCRFFDIEPSVALQRTNAKFTRRFTHVEKRMKENNEEMNPENLTLMDKYWDEAKDLDI